MLVTARQFLRRRAQAFSLAAALCLVVTRSASAHKGPPFPLVMEVPAGRYVASVWADPDIGQAEFFIVIESPGGGAPPDTPKVSMWVQPVSGRLGRVTYPAELQAQRNKKQYHVRPYFDRGDQWNVGFRIESSAGTQKEALAQVESTPPGFGIWDLAIYFFPFAILGVLWVAAIVRQRSRRMMSTSSAASSGLQDL